MTAAFFIPMSFAKTTVRKLIVTSAERARASALADARAHAYDVLRAAFGPFWRVRTPVLLRRQLRSGRLPAAVTAAVETCDAAVWEPAVQTWITAAVTLPGQVGRTLRAAAAVASADTGQDRPTDTEADNGPDKPADRMPDKRADNVPDISPDIRRTTRPPSQATRADKPADAVAAAWSSAARRGPMTRSRPSAACRRRRSSAAATRPRQGDGNGARDRLSAPVRATGADR